MSGMETYDLCFGGRREFCKTEYADLGEWLFYLLALLEQSKFDANYTTEMQY